MPGMGGAYRGDSHPGTPRGRTVQTIPLVRRSLRPWYAGACTELRVGSWTGGSLHRSFRRSEMERLYEKLPEFPG